MGSEEEDNADENDEQAYAKVHAKGRAANLGDIRRGQNEAESTTELLDETNMEASEVFIYGSGDSAKQVKIIELALQKPRTTCSHKTRRCKGWWYGLWVLFFKHHGAPPKSGTRYQYFLGYAIFLALDLLLTLNICFHMFQPLDNWKGLGIPYFFISPGATVLGPVCGLVGCSLASPRMLKMQASVNATSVLLNYPLTLALMIVKKDEAFYIAMIILLWFNKICISFFGAKVRQHLLNPGFCRNAEKIEERFNCYVRAKKEVDAGVKPGMSAEERAANLASAGPPLVGNDSDGEDDLQDEDDTSYGIIPKNRL